MTTTVFHVDDRVSHHLISHLHGTVKGVKNVGESVRYLVDWDNVGQVNFQPEWYRADRLRPLAW